MAQDREKKQNASGNQTDAQAKEKDKPVGYREGLRVKGTAETESSGIARTGFDSLSMKEEIMKRLRTL